MYPYWVSLGKVLEIHLLGQFYSDSHRSTCSPSVRKLRLKETSNFLQIIHIVLKRPEVQKNWCQMV